MSYTFKDVLKYLYDLQTLVHLKSMVGVSNKYFMKLLVIVSECVLTLSA